MFTEIQPKSKDFALNRKLLIFNDSGKILSKNSSQMQNLAQLGPKNCVCFFFVFSPLLLLLLLFVFYSSPDLNFCLYSPYILQDFRFKSTTFSASDRAHPPQTPPQCHVCKRAIDADAPPNSPPPQLSKTGVQPGSPV